jgi:alkanesulfonate monooxygenase SsuD/methylene tetrahydromethanopterin reductase-like flavin-dependent oxidoreductase (luciferase family)
MWSIVAAMLADYRLDDAQLEPRPLQARLPLMIGGESGSIELVVREVAPALRSTPG